MPYIFNPFTGKFDYYASGSTPGSIDALTDVDTTSTAPVSNDVLKWNGTNWVPAVYNATFAFSIASFDDGQGTTQLIGSGTWKTTGNIAFTSSYTNGPASSAYISIGSDGGVTWGGNLTLSTPYTSGTSAENTAYPSAKDKYIQFTLHASKGAESGTSAESAIYFRNYIYWGVATKNSGFSEADVEGLSGSSISNSYTTSRSINATSGQYLVIAYPSSYTTIPSGADYESDGGTGFLFNSIACSMKAPETVYITNSAGYPENYKVYASNSSALGNSSLQLSTSAQSIDNLYYGKTTKTSTFLESDIEGLANSSITNDNSQVWSSVTTGAGEYMLFSFPKRLGIPTFWVGGFEGGFESPETVSVTNINGWTEDYYAWRSTNSNLGATVVETK